MAKANSFKSEPWTGLDKGSYSIQDDDFVHDKLATFKVTKKSSTSTIALKETLSQKDNKITSAEEVKFWFPFRGTRTLYARLKNDSYKLHYDHGVQSQNDNQLNFYASVQGTRQLGGSHAKIGLELKNKDIVTNWRLRFEQDYSLTLYNKTSYTRGQWSAGFLNAFSIAGKVWNQSALQLAWTNADGNTWFLRANGGKKYEKVDTKKFLDEATINYVHKYSANTRFGLEAKASILNADLSNASAVWEHKCAEQENTAIKIKADLNRNIAFSVKNNLKDFGSYLFGVQVSDFGRSNAFKYGIQLDLNL